MPAVKDAETKIESLREKIRHHEYLYYVLDQPSISDQEFDQLMQQLKDLEAANPSLKSAFQRISEHVKPSERMENNVRIGWIHDTLKYVNTISIKV